MKHLLCGVVIGLLSMAASASDSLLRLTPDSRTGLALTVYSDFGVVRDVRNTTLPQGQIQLEFDGVAKTIDPSSVSARTLGDRGGIDVVRQSYQYDLLNKRSLLERYIGRKLRYSLSLPRDGAIDKVFREGTLLSIDPEIVQFGDSIEIAPDGVISLPYIPEGLKTTPTLVWTLDNSRRGSQQIETTYVADGLQWSADYTLVLNDSESLFDMSSWVNLTNQSGTTFTDASLKLVAGAVQRAPDASPRPMAMMARSMMDESSGGERRTLADYHLYEFPGSFTVADKETLQLKFRGAENVPVTKSYVSTSTVAMHQIQEPRSDRFDVRYTFEVADAGREPLPAGTVRVMKQDADGTLQLLGETRVNHTPVGEEVALTTGKAFDLGVERNQLSWRRLSNRSSEVTVEVTVTNSKDEPAEVMLQERMAGDWEVMSQTLSGERVDSTTLEYRLRLRGGESSTFTYTVRSTY